MAYRGATLEIPFSQSGFQHNPNMDTIPPTAVVDPSKNLNWDEGGARRRGGTAKVNSTAVSGSPEILSLFDMLYEDDSQFQVFHGANGSIYKNTTTTIKTGLSTTSKAHFVRFLDNLYTLTGADVVQTWDGDAAATSDISNPAAEWTGSNQPRYAVAHGRGASQRLWAFRVPNDRKSVWASAEGDDDFVTGVVKLTVDTGDGEGITGGVEFGDRLLLFGRTKAYYADDTDTDTANWGIIQAQWNGGVAHQFLLCKTPNDVVAMMEDGEIYSIVTAQSYGDYKTASLTKPSFMDRWIREKLNLTRVSQFHCVYDPVKRAIKFFVVRAGQTQIDTALVYFIDRPPEIAWMIHDNQASASGYKASCSAVVRVGAGQYEVYTGDYSGFIWKLEQSNRNDDSNAFTTTIRMPHMNFGTSRGRKHFKRGFLVSQPKGQYDMQIKIYIDGAFKETKTVTLSPTGTVLGTFVLGTDYLRGVELKSDEFDIGYYGQRLALEIANSNVNEDFFLTAVAIDYRDISKLTS